MLFCCMVKKVNNFLFVLIRQIYLIHPVNKIQFPVWICLKINGLALFETKWNEVGISEK